MPDVNHRASNKPVSGSIDSSRSLTGKPKTARFDKTKRLLNAAHYSAVFDNNDARASHRYVLMLGRSNGRDVSRLGLVIAKKHVRLAVQRNRIKRLAREVFRQLPAQTPSLDVVLLARKGIAELDNEELSSILLQQWQKLNNQLDKKHSKHSN